MGTSQIQVEPEAKLEPVDYRTRYFMTIGHINSIQHKLENLIDAGKIAKTEGILDIFKEFVVMRNKLITEHPRYNSERDLLYTHDYLTDQV